MTFKIYSNCMEKCLKRFLKKKKKKTNKQTTIDKIYFISYRYRNPIPISLVKTKENIVFFVNTYKGSFPRYGSQEQHRCGQSV